MEVPFKNTCMVIARQPFCWKWISVTKVSKYGKSKYSRALNASYTFQPLMSFCFYIIRLLTQAFADCEIVDVWITLHDIFKAPSWSHCVLIAISWCKFRKLTFCYAFFHLLRTCRFETRFSPLKNGKNASSVPFLQLYSKTSTVAPTFYFMVLNITVLPFNEKYLEKI